jgi:hypothetical protein
VSQVTLQGAAPQAALQSVPPEQVQTEATHMQPAPVQVGAAAPPLPQPATAQAASAKARIPRGLLVISTFPSFSLSPSPSPPSRRASP